MLTLTPQDWWGWCEQPFRTAGWSATPIFLCSVSPCGNGLGEIGLCFIEVLRPKQPAIRRLVLRIKLRRPDLIVGTYRDTDGAIRVATIAHCTPDWLRSNCSALLRARSPRFEILAGDGSWKASDYLEDLFGTSVEQIGGGGPAERSLGVRQPLPPAYSCLHIDHTFAPWQSRLVSIGFVPRSQDDRWCVFLGKDRLYAYRSWTGDLIYRAETSWIGDSLRLGVLSINRDRDQYRGGLDNKELAKFRGLLRSLLLGGDGFDPQR